MKAKGLAQFVRYSEVSIYQGSSYIFFILVITLGKENRLLYRGLPYIEVR